MNNISRCLSCYQPLLNSERDFHVSCAKKMFGTAGIPVIDFDLKQLDELAKQTINRSIAVTGVQPKLSLDIERHKNQSSRLTIVGLYGHYILKPPTATYAELPQNEDVTMHLAGIVKIKTAPHCLIRLNSGELAYLTKRFDRDKKGNKIAVEDFCQLTENLTEHKYRGSIEKVAKITRQFTANKGFELLRLFDLVLFCFLTGNADMHLKNFSLIENPLREFELSPAYDLLNTALAVPDDKEQSALTINSKKNRLGRKDFDTLAASMNINPKALAGTYQRFDNILPAWKAFIQQSFLSPAVQESYISLINARYKLLYS